MGKTKGHSFIKEMRYSIKKGAAICGIHIGEECRRQKAGTPGNDSFSDIGVVFILMAMYLPMVHAVNKQSADIIFQRFLKKSRLLFIFGLLSFQYSLFFDEFWMYYEKSE